MKAQLQLSYEWQVLNMPVEIEVWAAKTPTRKVDLG
jgi:hypothetical protein